MANKSKEVEAALQRAAKGVRDPVSGELESDDAHDRTTGYDGLAHGKHVSRNEHPQGAGDTVVPMGPNGRNSG
jgi:hypothetical protein